MLSTIKYSNAESQQIINPGHWIANLETHIITWSDTMYRIFSVSPTDFNPTYESILKLIHPEDRYLVKKWLKDLFAGKKPDINEYRIIWPNSRIRFIRCSGCLYYNLKNKPVLIVGTDLDITEKKQAEKRLKVSEESFRSLFVSCPIGLYRTTPDGEIVLANPALVKMLGFDSLEELTERNLEYDGFADPLQREKFKNILEETGVAANYESEWRRKDGSVIFIRENAKAVKDETGKIVFYDGTVEDITDFKLAENEIKRYKEHLEAMVRERTEELEKSYEMFRALCENSKDSIIRYDAQSRLLYANSALEKYTDISGKELIGKKLSELGLAKDLEKLIELSLKTVFETRMNHHAEFEAMKGVWIDWLLMPEYDLEGNVESVITAGRDITEAKKKQLELQHNLEKEQELINQFISTLSHELRNPLSTIMASADFLESGSGKFDSVQKAKYFDRIRRNVDYLTKMLNEILFISKLDSAKIKVNLVKTNLPEFCREIVEEIQAIYPEIKSTVSIDLEENWQNIDVLLMKKILGNLLSNAFKFNTENGHVAFTVTIKKNILIYKIADTGIGIPLEEQKNIFESFSRMSNAQHIKGSGLGLNIVKKSIERLGGKIIFSSGKNKGTVFTVLIPIT